MKSTIEAGQQVSQHRLQQASLYSWHFMSSALHHDNLCQAKNIW